MLRAATLSPQLVSHSDHDLAFPQGSGVASSAFGRIFCLRDGRPSRWHQMESGRTVICVAVGMGETSGLQRLWDGQRPRPGGRRMLPSPSCASHSPRAPTASHAWLQRERLFSSESQTQVCPEVADDAAQQHPHCACKAPRVETAGGDHGDPALQLGGLLRSSDVVDGLRIPDSGCGGRWEGTRVDKRVSRRKAQGKADSLAQILENLTTEWFPD